MTCTHHDITGKFNYFRHIRVRNLDGSFREEIRCFQCSKKWEPSNCTYPPEENGECEHEWTPNNPPTIETCVECSKTREKANQGGAITAKPPACECCEQEGNISCSHQKPSENQEGEGHQGAYQGECVWEDCPDSPECHNVQACKTHGHIRCKPQKPSEEEKAWRKDLLDMLERRFLGDLKCDTTNIGIVAIEKLRKKFL